VKIGPITQQLADACSERKPVDQLHAREHGRSEKQAVEDAFRHARTSADSVAKAAGRSVGELSYASVDTFENMRPVPMMARYHGDERPGGPGSHGRIHPQTVNVTAHVNALFTLK